MPFLVARDHDLRALGDGRAILAARAGHAARALLRINRSRRCRRRGSACSACPARRPCRNRPDRAALRAPSAPCARNQNTTAARAQAAQRGHAQRQHEPHAVVALQQVSRAAEPGQKRRDGAEIEPGKPALPRPRRRARAAGACRDGNARCGRCRCALPASSASALNPKPTRKQIR